MRLYIATNAKNGKRYVGMTATSLAKRISSHRLAAERGSMTIFHCAIRKHGIEAFTFVEVAQTHTRADLVEAERALIAQEQTRYPAGYNMTPGGDGFSGRHSPLSIERMKASQRATRAAETPEQKAERGRRISAAKKGKPQPWSNGDAIRGCKRSDAFKAAVSAGMKAYVAGLPEGEMVRRSRCARSNQT